MNWTLLFPRNATKVSTYPYLNYFIFRSNGLIVGGLDRGFISVYDATKILDGKGDNALVFTKDKHTGQVSISIVVEREGMSFSFSIAI